ncbi:class II aldolase/adducin family protein [Bacillus sp. SM2101]|uniref:class II aldolase/adducin family protein n=1 Tax=Bacillus sp. SM2101 TaxID=2805366 RepID=UPI001BDDF5DD|nr:class II aldolase/adducin family protein [Bacillus sp. SM2101]
MEVTEVKKMVCDAGKRLLSSGLVEGTWGNISARVDENTMVITPSGKNYADQTSDDMVVVNLEDLTYEGELKPSTECGLHAEIYKERKNVNSVIHTHSLHGCTVAAARKEIPPILDDMVQIVGPSIRVANYAISGTKKLTKNVIKALKGRNGALLANHGTICVGRSIDEAFVTCQVLEKACRIFIDVQSIGGAAQINKVEAIAMHQYYLKKYSKRQSI